MKIAATLKEISAKGVDFEGTWLAAHSGMAGVDLSWSSSPVFLFFIHSGI